VDIDLMPAVSFVESSNNPKAFNKKSKARGLYQITPIVLKEWNNYNPDENYDKEDLFDSEVNTRIASWYLNERIPQMLTYYKKPINLDNVLTSYNAGIDYVVKDRKLPSETVDYIRKVNSYLKDNYAKKGLLELLGVR
jgi:soluble lytic murein transglycosylase-like protein